MYKLIKMPKNKMNLDKLFYYFIFFHLILWTLIPSLTNINLPLDTIEALAWGKGLGWGNNKHPPLSSFILELNYFFFEKKDFTYYLLSQIFIFINFIFIFLINKIFFKEFKKQFFIILLTSLIFYYSYSSTEFNVNICLLPFWTSSIYLTYKAITKNYNVYWVLLGVTTGLGFLSKYIIIYLFSGILLFLLISFIQNKKFNYKVFYSLITFLIVVLPHINWLIINEFKTFNYALERASANKFSFFNETSYYEIILFLKSIFISDYNHINSLNLISKFLHSLKISFSNIFEFILKQSLFFLFFGIFHFVFFKFKKKKIKIGKNEIFLFCIFIFPILLLTITSLISGSKIRTMWMSPFYCLASTTIVYFFFEQKRKILLKLFLVLYLLSPTIYVASFYNDYTESRTKDQREKRVLYNGDKVALFVQKEWNKIFDKEIKYVIGDEWYAGNLSYHLKDRPYVYIHKRGEFHFVNKKIENLNEIINYGTIVIDKDFFEINSSFRNYEINKFFFLSNKKNKIAFFDCSVKKLRLDDEKINIYIIIPNCK